MIRSKWKTKKRKAPEGGEMNGCRANPVLAERRNRPIQKKALRAVALGYPCLTPPESCLPLDGRRGFAGPGGDWFAGGRRCARVGLETFFYQDFDDVRIGERGGVANLIRLAFGDLAQDAAHDFTRARLRQRWRKLQLVRRGNRPDFLADAGPVSSSTRHW